MNECINDVLQIYFFAVYFPACLACAAVLFKHPGKKLACLAVVLINPALIIIDHGHFQYNCISLGFAVRRNNYFFFSPYFFV